MTKFSELSQAKAVQELEGEVICHWKLREIDSKTPFADNGPLKHSHARVFSLLLSDDEKNKIMVYFYDAWGAGAYNITNGDHLIITSPPRTVFPSNKESGDNNPFCIALSVNAGMSISDEIQVRIRRKPSLEFILTSGNIMTTSIPAPALEVKLKRAQVNTMEAASKKAKIANTVYTYMSWDDVNMYDNVEVNFYAMIYDYNCVKTNPSATHRHSISFGIIGLTPSPTSIIPMVIFSKDELKIPRPVAVGDIIRVHRAKMQRYQELPQVVAWVDKSSFVVFHRKCNVHTGIPLSILHKSNEPDTSVLRDWHIISSSDGYSWTDSDQETLDITYTASQKFLLNAPNDCNDRAVSSLYDVEHHINATGHDVAWDTVAMVVNVLLPEAQIGGVDKDDPLCMRLLIWDGTSAGDMCIDERTSSILSRHTFYHVYAAIRCGVSYIRQDVPSAQTTVSAAMFDALVADEIVDPLVDFVPPNVKFAASDANVKILGGFSYVKVTHSAKQRSVIRDLRLVPGQWVRLKKIFPDNSEFRVSDDIKLIASAKFNEASIINVLPTYHRDVLAVLKAFEKRLRLLPRPLPPRQLISSSGLPFTTVAVCLASPAPAVFVALVKIVGWYPPDLDELVYTDTSNAHSVQRYMFSLRVRDDTAFADVIVYGKEGQTLLGGISAEEYTKNAEAKEAIRQRVTGYVEEETLVELKLCSYMTSRGVGQSADDDDHRPLLKRLAVFDTCLI